MRVVRIQGCLPTLLFLLAGLALAAVALTVGAVAFALVAGAFLVLAVLRKVLGATRPRPPRPPQGRAPPGAARHAIVEAEGGTLPDGAPRDAERPEP